MCTPTYSFSDGRLFFFPFFPGAGGGGGLEVETVQSRWRDGAVLLNDASALLLFSAGFMEGMLSHGSSGMEAAWLHS